MIRKIEFALGAITSLSAFIVLMVCILSSANDLLTIASACIYLIIMGALVACDAIEHKKEE